MLLDEFDYPLSAELIAQRPLAERDASRMMVVDRASAGFEDRLFREVPQILKPGDLLVFNNTRVFPARLLVLLLIGPPLLLLAALASAMAREEELYREYHE